MASMTLPRQGALARLDKPLRPVFTRPKMGTRRTSRPPGSFGSLRRYRAEGRSARVRGLGLRHKALQHLLNAETRGPRARRKLLEALKPLSNVHLRRHPHEHAIDHPFVIVEALLAAFERIAAQVEGFGNPHLRERLPPNVETRGTLLVEHDFPIMYADGHKLAVVAPIKEARARRFFHVALEVWRQIDAIEMDLVGLVADFVALLHLLDEVGLAGRRREGRDEVLERSLTVDHLAGLDDPRPAHNAGHTPAALPVGVLLSSERR